MLTSLAMYCPEAAAASTKFPHYPAIKNNVLFWEKIYSTYSRNQAVIHDSDDLSRVYAVIPLLDKSVPGADSKNSATEKSARKKYSTILKELSQRSAATREEIRIAALFSGKNNRKRMENAAKNVRSQRGVKEMFLEGVIRSGAYLPEMKKIFKSYGLPQELIYLPHVESSFNTRAYSKFGASGIWQITRSTGERYLKIDHTLDERLDPILATHAAAKYLKNSYDILGSWPLALTSYNYGTSGMMRAVKAEGSYENIFKNYNKGHFKFASKNFYSEFLAALKVAKLLEQRNAKYLATPLSNKYFMLPGYIHIDNVIRHFNTMSITIKKLNPALRSPVFTGEKFLPKGYRLRLPAKKSTNRRIATIPASLFQKSQKPSLYHRVKKGDTASSIAKQHKISLKQLMQANNLDKDATIYLRQKLRIPTKQGQHIASASSHVPLIKAREKKNFSVSTVSSSPDVIVANKKEPHQPQLTTSVPKQDPTIYNVTKKYIQQNKQYGTIIVQPEEAIKQYSQWLGVPSFKLASLNKLPRDATISPGQKLLLVFDKLSPEAFEEMRLDFLQETEEDFFSAFKVVDKKSYKVLAGDTLWELCHKKFDIPLWLLQRYNSTMDLTTLNTNQKLIIPLVLPL